MPDGEYRLPAWQKVNPFPLFLSHIRKVQRFSEYLWRKAISLQRLCIHKHIRDVTEPEIKHIYISTWHPTFSSPYLETHYTAFRCIALGPLKTWRNKRNLVLCKSYRKLASFITRGSLLRPKLHSIFQNPSMLPPLHVYFVFLFSGLIKLHFMSVVKFAVFLSFLRGRHYSCQVFLFIYLLLFFSLFCG